MNEKILFHIDVNSAFLSWEAAYRSAAGIDKIDLRTVPSIVGGDIQKRRGIVLAKSIPAKKFDIQTGEPVISALKKCPSLVVVSPTYGLYMKASQSFVRLLQEYSPIVEQYSVDECFMDYTQSVNIFGDPLKTADEIRRRMKEELGFSVNVGIAHNKLLAKMASELKKPDKTHTLFENEIKDKMWPLDVSELFMVGRHTASNLKALGIQTIGQLACTDLKFLIRHFKKSRGLMLHNYANGIDHSNVTNILLQAKSVGNSTTLPHDVYNARDAHLVILSLCEMVAHRLRNQDLQGDVISVSFKNFGFQTQSCQKKIFRSTNHTQIIYDNCVSLFNSMWRGEGVRLLGVSVSNLSSCKTGQMSFWDSCLYERQTALDKTIDGLRNQYGNKIIMRGSFIDGKCPPMQGGTGNHEKFPAIHSWL